MARNLPRVDESWCPARQNASTPKPSHRPCTGQRPHGPLADHRLGPVPARTPVTHRPPVRHRRPRGGPGPCRSTPRPPARLRERPRTGPADFRGSEGRSRCPEVLCSAVSPAGVGAFANPAAKPVPGSGVPRCDKIRKGTSAGAGEFRVPHGVFVYGVDNAPPERWSGHGPAVVRPSADPLRRHRRPTPPGRGRTRRRRERPAGSGAASSRPPGRLRDATARCRVRRAGEVLHEERSGRDRRAV